MTGGAGRERLVKRSMVCSGEGSEKAKERGNEVKLSEGEQEDRGK